MSDNKIFQKEVVAYLKEAGVDDNYIRAKQHEVAKSNILKLLDQIRAYIVADELSEVEKHLAGCEDHFINFKECLDGAPGYDKYAFDIGDMLSYLRIRETVGGRCWSYSPDGGYDHE